uniref:Phage portal protein n=1 Tax=Ascaris lumbricoides TaxID=6252 RepID=A0A0M3IRZ3_ASCLU
MVTFSIFLFSRFEQIINSVTGHNEQMIREVKTAYGWSPYSKIAKDVYDKYGFVIDQLKDPFAKLKRREPLMCSAVFEEWLAIANLYNPKQNPPKEIPPHMLLDFAMNGTVPLYKWYFNENMNTGEPRLWTKEYIDELVRKGDISEDTTYAIEGGMS